VMTVYNSACVTLGVDFSATPIKTSNFKRDLMVAISTALSDLVNRSIINIKLITIYDVPQDAALGVVSWVDLTTGTQLSTPIGPS